MNPPNQANQPFPRLSAPIADPTTGMATQGWQWLFISMWQKLGGALTTVPTATFAKQQPGIPITLHDATTGNQLATMVDSVGLTMPPEFTVTDGGEPNSPISEVSWVAQAPLAFLAGPTPSFRLIVPADLPIATDAALGIVQPDNTTITISDGVISAVGGGGSLEVTDGTTTVSAVTEISFTGATVTNGGTGIADVAISGGSSGADPTATAGPTAVDGSATTFMRSDGAPAVQTATTGQLGLVEPDGDTIIIYDGKISVSAPAVTNKLVLSDGYIYVGNSFNIATGVAMSGMVAIDDTGATTVQTATTGQLGVVEPDGTTITISDGVISASGGGGSGTVTSVGLALDSGLYTVSGSPVTTSGTLTGTLDTQSANEVFAGPSSGSATAPAFRSLVTADLPTTAVTPGSYTSTNLTVDATGRITAAADGSGGGGTVTTTGSPASGNLTKFSGSTSITDGDLSGDVSTSGTLVTTLAASGVSAGTYGDSTHVPQVTVDTKGRVTAASNVAISRRYDMAIFLPGSPGGSQFLFNDIMVAACSLPASLTGSSFRVNTNPSANMTFTFLKNGSSIGTVVFNTSGVPTVTFSSSQSFNGTSDVFAIQAQASADSTGADIGIFLAWSLT